MKGDVSPTSPTDPRGGVSSEAGSEKQCVPYAYFPQSSGPGIGYLLPFLDCFEGVTEYQTSTFSGKATNHNGGGLEDDVRVHPISLLTRQSSLPPTYHQHAELAEPHLVIRNKTQNFLPEPSALYPGQLRTLFSRLLRRLRATKYAQGYIKIHRGTTITWERKLR